MRKALSKPSTGLIPFCLFLPAGPNGMALNIFDMAPPTYSSWLNQVEIWFSKIQRDVIARGIFTSISDLSTKLIRYVRQYNKTATPFCWRYKNADHRIKPTTQRASDSLH